MSRREAARQSRGGAATGPDAGPSDRAGTRIENSTAATADVRQDPNTASEHRALAAAEAQAIVGSVMWLAAAADWLAERLDAAAIDPARSPETVLLLASDAERLRLGLVRCVELLDAVAVDPAALHAAEDDGASPEQPSAGRSLH